MLTSKLVAAESCWKLRIAKFSNNHNIVKFMFDLV